ncbi:acyl-CoA dehydrogenase family protein [Nocardia xishanensis]|uniref:Acyl-CoA dehydrogenase family protein n=1 Tax=Nocardia xishanensis TaxID=238964 RepID=A0ABW7XBS1_9NOCA
MNSDSLYLRDAVRQILSSDAESNDRSIEWTPRVWSALTDAGMTTVGIDEGAGGSGGALTDAATVIREAAWASTPIPIAETSVLAGWLLSSAGLDIPAGPLSCGWSSSEPPRLRRSASGWVLDGRLDSVPWASVVTHLAVLARDTEGTSYAALVPASLIAIDHRPNIAGEPGGSCRFDDVALPEHAVRPADRNIDEFALEVRGALFRTIGIDGALGRVLELCVDYAKQRQQFGRPIAQFQAIQQQLVVLAGEAAAAAAACDAALAAYEADSRQWQPVALAKIRAGEAVTTSTAIAHQVFGAIGISLEHTLQRYTRRLWAWRDEYGTEAWWAGTLTESASTWESFWNTATKTLS